MKPPKAFPGLTPSAWDKAARSIARTSQIDVQRLLTPGRRLPRGREAALRSLAQSLERLYGLTADEAWVAARAVGPTAQLMGDSLLRVLDTVPAETRRALDASAAWVADRGLPVLVNDAAVANMASRTTAAITADWTRLAATSREGIVGTLRQAIVGGKNPAVAAREMYQGIYGQVGLTHARCLTIARTEMGDAYQAANIETYRNAGAPAYRWFAAVDDLTCALCLALHGSVFPLDQEPETHPNCRCEMLPVFADEMGQVGRDGRWPGQKVPRSMIAARLPGTWTVPKDPRDLVGVRDNPNWRPAKVLVKPT